MVKVFNGKKLAQELEKKIKKKAGELEKKADITPKLVSIVVGDDKARFAESRRASHLYLSLQEKAAKRTGILFEKKVFSSQTEPEEIYQYINSLNKDKKVQGIVIQMPLPKKFDLLELAVQIKPEKDVDCLNPENQRRLIESQPVFLPAVVKAVLLILENQQVNLRDKQVVVVGASGFVGLPLVAHLENLGVEVIPCDEFTKNLEEWTKKGDILISVTGVASLIKKEMVKKGAMVIDVGSPKGDVDFEEVKKIASFITPVPGGVGPLTIACLMESLLFAIEGIISSKT